MRHSLRRRRDICQVVVSRWIVATRKVEKPPMNVRARDQNLLKIANSQNAAEPTPIVRSDLKRSRVPHREFAIETQGNESIASLAE